MVLAAPLRIIDTTRGDSDMVEKWVLPAELLDRELFAEEYEALLAVILRHGRTSSKKRVYAQLAAMLGLTRGILANITAADAETIMKMVDDSQVGGVETEWPSVIQTAISAHKNVDVAEAPPTPLKGGMN